MGFETEPTFASIKTVKSMEEIIPISIWPKGMINCFLIKGTKKHILVDTGVPDSEAKIIKQIEAHGINIQDIGLIVITHAHTDHFGSVGKLKQILKVPILAHKLELEAYKKGKADISTMKLNKPQWWFFKRMVEHV